MPPSITELTVKPLPPEEALAFWRDKTPITAEVFKSLEAGARARAFAVAGLARLDQVSALQTALADALEQGETLASFKKRAAAIIEEAGWKGRRVENIFRTNVQQAYQAGRYVQMRRASKARPYWQYVAVQDRRTRPAHAVLDGKVYPADHEFWNAHYPPNGFQCRCTVRSLSPRQVEAERLTVERDMPGPQVWTDDKTGMEHFVNMPGPDRGFAGNPGKDWLQGLAPSPLDDGAVVFPQAPALCRRGGPAFADHDQRNDPCRPPLASLDPRHILPIREADLLPRGLAPTAYVRAFLAEFGLKDMEASTVITLPSVKMPVVISKALFIDKASGEFKVTKEGREAYLRLLARTIKSPYEIWLTPAALAGRRHAALRLIRLFRGKGTSIGGFAVFSLIGRNWHGSTVFNPKGTNTKSMLEYLERQRAGALLYREGE